MSRDVHKNLNPMRIFSAILYDPMSIFFGVHHLYSGNKRLALLHGSIGVTSVVLWTVFGILYTNFVETCCYSKGTSRAVMDNGGPCNSGVGLTYNHAGCATWPAHLHGCLYAAIALLLGNCIFWYATIDQYRYTISTTVWEITSHRIAEESQFADDIQYEKFISTVAWFPLVGIMLGLHLLYSHGIASFLVQNGLVLSTIITWIGATEISRINIDYGCYFWTDRWEEMGEYGLCTDKTSVAYGMSNSGRISKLWPKTIHWWAAVAVSTGCLLIWFIAMRFGWFAWGKWIILPTSKRYVRAVRRYIICTRHTYQTKGPEWCNKALIKHQWMLDFCQRRVGT